MRYCASQGGTLDLAAFLSSAASLGSAFFTDRCGRLSESWVPVRDNAGKKMWLAKPSIEQEIEIIDLIGFQAA